MFGALSLEIKDLYIMNNVATRRRRVEEVSSGLRGEPIPKKIEQLQPETFKERIRDIYITEQNTYRAKKILLMSMSVLPSGKKRITTYRDLVFFYKHRSRKQVD